MERKDKIHIIIISQAATILVIFILLFFITQFAHMEMSISVQSENTQNDRRIFLDSQSRRSVL